MPGVFRCPSCVCAGQSGASSPERLWETRHVESESGCGFPMESSGEEADCSFAFSGSSGKAKWDVLVASAGWERGAGVLARGTTLTVLCSLAPGTTLGALQIGGNTSHWRTSKEARSQTGGGLFFWRMWAGEKEAAGQTK